jgi:UDP-N-acetylmuramate--alanine ligase
MKNTSVSLDNVKNIHMIGIGGSGMFSIAKVLLEKGFHITGSDSAESETTEKVRNLGIKLFIGHYPSNIDKPDLVVYSAAIKNENPEIQTAQKREIPCIERSVMLGLIVNKYKTSVAVSGTHGKTSTTSIITHILLDSGKDPTAIIGGTLPRINGNSCTGSSDIIVCEACEYVDSFLEISPSISVVLNVDADHLDYFKDIQGVKSSFAKFINLTRDLAIINGDDKNAVEISKDTACRKLFYGLSEENDYYAKNITFNEHKYPSFDMFHGGTKLTHIALSIPGKHNIYNALAAAVVCLEVGVLADKISESIKSFKGAHRRFEILDRINDITIADDFAHHPTEIKATLSAAKEMNFKKVIVVFQPHTFSRTFTFLNEFAEVLSLADKVILTDILPVREINTFNIHSEDLAKKIEGCVCVNTFSEAAELIPKIAGPKDLVLTMGGGNIYQCADMIISNLKNQKA